MITVDCRPACGACCIAPSITTPIPGLPEGKPAGVPCVQLRPDFSCALFGKPERPAVCASLRPSREMCGAGREHALAHLAALEAATAPDAAPSSASAGVRSGGRHPFAQAILP
ncbi:YkgJ family cysteine cluster protein [Termitidicoccus mucosus]|uniref:Proteinase inhibitor n=1 Tax=Termitidicoccus mucosus TaxID=1184151 RepID=A0A178IKI6_9BACT|nr:proteinase inhibitor [Opitutaceae bacterium TSB47]